MSEASEIARRSILSRPARSIFPPARVLPTEPVHPRTEQDSSEEDTALALMRVLARAGRRIKSVFAAVHGEGLVWFNVIPDLDDEEQAFARAECAGLVRQLSRESREFAFSAALAAEIFPDLARAADSEAPSGVDLGVFYKALQAAACGYAEAYVHCFENPAPQPLGAPARLDMAEPPRNGTIKAEIDAEKVDGVYEDQTAMIEIQQDLMDRMRRLEEWCEAQDVPRNVPEAIDAECEAALRGALGSRFDELAERTRSFLLEAERHYTYPHRESDFTAAMISLTKAFECEFRRRVIEPLFKDLEILALTASTFKAELSRFTLGQYRALFDKYPLRTEPLFERLGLQHKGVCTAISRVNKEKDVKHSTAKGRSKADVTAFRAAFLSGESVFNPLFPRP